MTLNISQHSQIGKLGTSKERVRLHSRWLLEVSMTCKRLSVADSQSSCDQLTNVQNTQVRRYWTRLILSAFATKCGVDVLSALCSTPYKIVLPWDFVLYFCEKSKVFAPISVLLAFNSVNKHTCVTFFFSIGVSVQVLKIVICFRFEVNISFRLLFLAQEQLESRTASSLKSIWLDVQISHSGQSGAKSL